MQWKESIENFSLLNPTNVTEQTAQTGGIGLCAPGAHARQWAQKVTFPVDFHSHHAWIPAELASSCTTFKLLV